MAYLDGVSFIQGQYSSQEKIEGMDSNSQTVVYGKPVLEFEKLSMEGTPIHMYFKMDGEKVKLEYSLIVKTNIEGAIPMALKEFDIRLKFPDSDIKDISLCPFLVPGQRPQIVKGSKTWDNVYDFLSVKKAILDGPVFLEWDGQLQWVDISSPEMQANIKKEDYRPNPQITHVTGTISIDVANDCESASYKGMFEGVKNLLCWESEIIDGERVYYKDPYKDDAIYFLPQEYRIKALRSNAPDITTEIVKEGDKQKILTRIRIAPYVHPNAKRDAFKIFMGRKGKKYCNLLYGGFDSTRFAWGRDMINGKLYGDRGFTSIINEKEIQASPDSSFLIVLETPQDDMVKFFQEKITEDDLVIGEVYFKVHDGIDDKKEKELGPIKVNLNLHKLVGIQPEVRIDNCTWPDYEATITNRGSYPIEIGGLTMSVLRWKDNKVLDAEHELESKSSEPFPVTLDHDASVKVGLTQDQVERIKHRKLAGIGKVDENYWNELICEPYSFRLHDKDIEEVLTKVNETAAYEHEDWILTLEQYVEWPNHPELAALQVGIRNKFGLNEIVTFTGAEEKTRISMTPNLNATLQTRLAGNQQFEYRIRRIMKDGPKDPEWTAWYPCSGNYLFLREEDLNEPTVPNDPEPIDSTEVNGAQQEAGSQEPESEFETKELVLSFWMSWNKDVKEVIVDVLYDDDNNNIHFTKPNIRLTRDDNGSQNVTLQVKDPEIKPKILVRYQGKKLTMSDVTTVNDLMVKLPSAAPPFTGESVALNEALDRLGDIKTPHKQLGENKSKKEKRKMMIGLAIGLLTLLAILIIYFVSGSRNSSNAGNNTVKGTEVASTNVSSSKAQNGNGASALADNDTSMEDLNMSFTVNWEDQWRNVYVEVSYDDDKNNIHANRSFELNRESLLPYNVTFRVKKSGVRPQVKVTYVNNNGVRVSSNKLTVSNYTVDLPFAFPPKGERTIKTKIPIKKKPYIPTKLRERVQ